MTFLNPFILFGLLAAGIPILLHLLNLRKLRTIEFSTLSFLKELQRTKIRRIKIRQWLLLLLRTLLVICIVMAFARPTLKGS
ncbi:MAG TPA: BatA domain-containing protein, partial [Bacteroidota bacterium]